MTNLARFTINASASSPGGFDTTAGQTLSLLLEASSSLVRRVSFQVYDPAETNPPRSSKAAPLLTLVGASMGSRVDAANPATPVTVTIPASGAHSWIVRCIVNGGLDDNERPSADLVFERMICIRNGGRRKIVASEGTQYEPDGWAGAQNDDVDAGGGGGGGGGYVTFQNQGSALPSRAVANFTGAGVTSSDVGGITTINIPGGPAATAAGQTQVWSGTAWTAGALDLADADARTGTLPAGNGGTGIAGAGGVANRVLTTLNGTSWAAGLVALATMVSGQLSTANLPDGSANSVLGRAVASVGAQASIPAALDGQTLRLASSTLAFGALNLASPNAITGLLPLANLTGGSAVGQTLRNTAGNVPAWGATDLADSDAVTGQLPFANIANGAAWSVFARASGTVGVMASLAATADGQYLQRVGGALTWATIAVGSVGVTSLGGGSAVGQVLVNTAGNVPAWGALDLADPDARTGTLPATNGGTGIGGAGGTANRALVTTDGSTWSAGQVALATMVSGLLPLANVAGGSAVGQVLVNGASNIPAWGALDLADADAVTGLLPLANFANGSSLSVLGRATSTTGVMASIAASVDGTALRRSGTTLGFGTLAAGAFADGTIAVARLVNATASSVLGRSAATAGAYADITSSADGQVLRRGASGVIAFGAVDLADSDAITGLLPLANVAGASGNSGKALLSNGSAWAANNDVFADGSSTALRIAGSSVFVADASGIDIITTGTSAPLRLRVGGGSQFSIGNTEVVQAVPLFTFGTSVATPRIWHNPDSTAGLATANKFSVQAQSRTGTGATIGAELELMAGTGATDGVTSIKGNTLDLYVGKSGGPAQVLNQMGPAYLDFDIATAAGASGRYDIRYNGTTFISFARSLGNGMRMSFFGVTPTTRLADPGAMTATAGSTDDTIVDVGASFNQTTLNNNFRDLVAKLNLLRGYLQTYGLCV